MAQPTQVSQALSTPSVTSLIPQGYLDELLVLREHFNQGYWRVGDIVNNVYALAVANGWHINKLDVCHGVGVIIGKSGRSVRFYSDVAGFYPPAVREAYPEIPFSHFAYAMKFPGLYDGRLIPDGQPGGLKPMWRAVLDSSLKMFEDGGIPPSVERLAVEWEHHENQLRESYQHNVAPAREIFAVLPEYIDPVLEENSAMESSVGGPDPYPDDLGEMDTEDTTAARRGEYVRALKNLLTPVPSIVEALKHLAVPEEDIVTLARGVIYLRTAIGHIEGEEGVYSAPKSMDESEEA
jgi:hypothetical protein